MKLARGLALALTVGFLLSAIQAPCTATPAEADTVLVPYYAGSMLLVVYVPCGRPSLPWWLELMMWIDEHWPENADPPAGNGGGGYGGGSPGWDD